MNHFTEFHFIQKIWFIDCVSITTVQIPSTDEHQEMQLKPPEKAKKYTLSYLFLTNYVTRVTHF